MRNSTKFTFKGYIQLKAKPAKIRAKKEDTVVSIIDAIQFEIYDTGIGINEENQANLFQLFAKV